MVAKTGQSHQIAVALAMRGEFAVQRFWLCLTPLALVMTLSFQQAAAQEPWASEMPAEMQLRLASEFPPFFGYTGRGRADGLAGRSFEYAEAMSVRAFASIPVLDAIIDDLGLALALGGNRFLSGERRIVFQALLANGQCEAAHDVLWNGIVEDRPYLASFANDAHFLRRLRWQVYGANLVDFVPPELADAPMPDLRGLAACFAAVVARRSGAIITDWANDSTIPDVILRPFTDFPMLINANGSIHGARDGNYWHLIHMATQGEGGGYGPAGLMFVELALGLESINVPDDVLHMLLLRAEATWPELDGEWPLPVERSRIAALLPVTEARLTEDALAHAERCFLTDEPYRRLFLGDAVYADVPEDERCMTVTP